MERRVEIVVDTQKMNAFLIFHPLPDVVKNLDRGEVDDAINALFIKFGIHEERIRAFLENSIPEVPYPFAQGVLPEPSKDAEVIFNFDHEKLKLYCSGKISQKERNNYREFLVKKGSLIAKKIPAFAGKKGTDVFGNEVIPKPPKEKSLLPNKGDNTLIDEDGLKLLSAQDGVLRLDGEKITVDGILLIHGDLDAGYGNIDFEGSIVIEGMVMPGFVIKAREDIKVSDIVEAATLIAGKDIEINSGVKGRNKAFLSAGRDIKVRFVENAELEAKRDILVDSSAVNSILKAKRDVIVVGEPGSIIGGTISAGHIVEAKEIGSDMNLKTTVDVGIDPDLRQRATLLHSQVSMDYDNLNKLTMIVKKLRELKNALGDKFPADKIELLVKTINSINNLNAEIPRMQAEIEEIDIKIASAVTGARIIAQKVMKPGTEVTIRDRKFYTTRALEKVVLVLEEGEIRIGGYSGNEKTTK